MTITFAIRRTRRGDSRCDKPFGLELMAERHSKGGRDEADYSLAVSSGCSRIYLAVAATHSGQT